MKWIAAVAITVMALAVNPATAHADSCTTSHTPGVTYTLCYVDGKYTSIRCYDDTGYCTIN